LVQDWLTERNRCNDYAFDLEDTVLNCKNPVHNDALRVGNLSKEEQSQEKHDQRERDRRNFLLDLRLMPGVDWLG